MRIGVTQLRKIGADANLPQFIHTGYDDDSDDAPITAVTGYEISAVYIFH